MAVFQLMFSIILQVYPTVYGDNSSGNSVSSYDGCPFALSNVSATPVFFPIHFFPPQNHSQHLMVWFYALQPTDTVQQGYAVAGCDFNFFFWSLYG